MKPLFTLFALLALSLLAHAAAPVIVSIELQNGVSAATIKWTTAGEHAPAFFEVRREVNGVRDQVFRIPTAEAQQSFIKARNKSSYTWTDTNDIVLGVTYTYKVRALERQGAPGPWSKEKGLTD